MIGAIIGGVVVNIIVFYSLLKAAGRDDYFEEIGYEEGEEG